MNNKLEELNYWLVVGKSYIVQKIEQDRKDLALPEIDQAEVISQFLPEALSEEEIEKVVVMTIDQIGAEGMKDMGKVMGIVSKELAGQADGKTISTIVKAKLMS